MKSRISRLALLALSAGLFGAPVLVACTAQSRAQSGPASQLGTEWQFQGELLRGDKPGLALGLCLKDGVVTGGLYSVVAPGNTGERIDTQLLDLKAEPGRFEFRVQDTSSGHLNEVHYVATYTLAAGAMQLEMHLAEDPDGPPLNIQLAGHPIDGGEGGGKRCPSFHVTRDAMAHAITSPYADEYEIGFLIRYTNQHLDMVYSYGVLDGMVRPDGESLVWKCTVELVPKDVYGDNRFLSRTKVVLRTGEVLSVGDFDEAFFLKNAFLVDENGTVRRPGSFSKLPDWEWGLATVELEGGGTIGAKIAGGKITQISFGNSAMPSPMMFLGADGRVYRLPLSKQQAVELWGTPRIDRTH